MNTSKKDPEAYRKIAVDLHLSPEMILYIDDSAENIEAATIAGFKCLHYQDNKGLFKEIKKWLQVVSA